MMPISPGIQEMNNDGCCSQGVSYHRSVIPQVLDQMKVEMEVLVETQIEKLADAGDFVRWAIVPPLPQHIGAMSPKSYDLMTMHGIYGAFDMKDIPI